MSSLYSYSLMDRIRFVKNVGGATLEGCWPWVGKSKSGRGYGYFLLNGKMTRANRAVWMLWKGSIPADMQVLHRCDNPGCVNPDHLFLGTYMDNINDMVRKGRHKWQKGLKRAHEERAKRTHCHKGHEYNDANTSLEKTVDGYIGKRCLACKRERQNNYV